MAWSTLSTCQLQYRQILVLLVSLLALSAPARGQCQGQWVLGDGIPGVGNSGAGGTVYALALLPGGDLAVGGPFNEAGGVPTNGVARWDGTNWSSMGPANGLIPAFINALTITPTGDLIGGGQFRTTGTPSFTTVARWTGSTWQAFGSAMNPSNVLAVAALANGDVVVGGDFTSAGGVSASRLARWDGSAWSPLGGGVGGVPSSSVNALAVLPDGSLLVGGHFFTAGTTTVNNVARWDGSGWSNLNGGVTASSFASVNAITVAANGDAFVAGSFANAGGGAASNVARWNASGWSALGVGVAESISAITLLANGNVVVGPGSGGFIRSWNGSTWTIVGNANNGVLALQGLPNGRLVAGGAFNSIQLGSFGTVSVRGMAQLDAAVTRWAPVGPGFDNVATLFTWLPSGDLIAAGPFSYVGGQLVNRIARWNGSNWSPIGSGPGFSITSIAVMPNADIIAGGTVGIVPGPERYIARWDGSAWQSIGTGTNDYILAVAVLPNGDIVAGGFFTAAGGAPANHIARWNGSAWSEFGGGTNGNVTALTVLQNGDLVAGGSFTTAGGVPAASMARWNGTTWLALGGGPGAGATQILELPNGHLAACGSFSLFAKEWNGVSWSALGGGFSNSVNSLALGADGNIIASGSFNLPGGSGHIARLVGATWTGYGTRPLSGFAIAPLPNGDLLSGGSFLSAGGHTPSYFATWRIPSADFDRDGAPGTDADIEAFFSCLAGNCCATCGTVDFNGDGDVGTDADIEAFFRVLAGGSC